MNTRQEEGFNDSLYWVFIQTITNECKKNVKRFLSRNFLTKLSVRPKVSRTNGVNDDMRSGLQWV